MGEGLAPEIPWHKLFLIQASDEALLNTRALTKVRTVDYKTWRERLLLRMIDFAVRQLEELFPPKVTLVASFGQPRLKQKLTHAMITRQINFEQEIDGLCDPRTGGGNPAPVDGPVRWEVLDGNSTLGAISEDGKVAVLRSEDGLGTSHFKATADANMGAGVQEISEIYELVVVAPDAATVGGSFGEPRQKTPLTAGKK